MSVDEAGGGAIVRSLLCGVQGCDDSGVIWLMYMILFAGYGLLL